MGGLHVGKSFEQHTSITIGKHTVKITNPNKEIWPEVTKFDYLKYLVAVSNQMLPFLKDRLLTVIRYPNGVAGEAFYQKNCPDYAPQYVKRYEFDGTNFIVCSDLATLLWLGNQGAIEYHIPFQTINSNSPEEIVIDLDPPSKNDFILAVKAALILKDTFEKLNIQAFIKTSGNKGMQIFIPIKKDAYSYEQTRSFTSFIATYLVHKEPNMFTMERLKKNRGNKLYIDFIQHAEGKTIIAPYSTRGNKKGLVSTPLLWEEINSNLSPNEFTMSNNVQRINSSIFPFEKYETARRKNNLKNLIEQIEKM
jgi:DNA ligase D